jgi:hypothetical protein
VQYLTFIFNLMAALVGVVAAVYWYRSATVTYPPILQATPPPIAGGSVVNTRPLLQALEKSGQLNKIAARYTASASLLAAFSLLAGLLQQHEAILVKLGLLLRLYHQPLH